MNDRDNEPRGARPSVTDTDVAIVGMSGRFPGAADVDELWARVARGDDCLADITDADLLAAGIDPSTCADEHYVRRDGVVDGIDLFDPAFFGIGARDAALMDPQHRLLHECAWEAMETAGYVPERFDGAIGVFAGCGVNTYLLHNILTNPDLIEDLGWFLVRHTGNDKDFLSTGISYRLGLQGPSVSVQTACSTSLVAVHLAVQSLLAFECDMALAGGVTIDVPHGTGYRYRDGEILSPTGRCRAFDESSDGTILTGGAGVVALRRATDAVDDNDPILAVIKASAVNNDGARKVGYLAPSVDGHADVVREALSVGEIDPRTITLLEAHGTGTAVGDPIEFTALSDAFANRTGSDERQFCRLVSTKPNIGHLDTAAGVASLIKVVQALRHRKLPPLANHRAPSPLLDLEQSPFVISGELTEWHSDGPRRAGVSSLGVGGTNAHVIVEEAPSAPRRTHHTAQVLCLSGHTEASLDATSERLASFLEGHADVELADVAFTLADGRRDQPHRRVVAATDPADAVLQLRSRRSSGAFRGVATADEPPSVVFLLPGGGAQYAGMGSGLDDRFQEFHRTMSTGIELVGDVTGLDLRSALRADADPHRIREADVSLPAVFLIDVAIARQWMEWGVTPKAIAGHSLGEYAAAHLAGVFSFEDAIRVVAQRARLMKQVGSDGTAMLAVSMSAQELEDLLPADVSVAVINTPRDCVLSGTAASIQRLTTDLDRRDADHALLPLALAAHSSLLDPILDEFLDFMGTISLGEPQLPYVSNLTGTWARPEDATNPRYWTDHLRNTVRFSDNLLTVLELGPTVTAELGPGHTLSSFARRMPTRPVAAIAALRHPDDPVDDTAFAIGAFAGLWANGVPVEPADCIGNPANRVTLPPTAFDRERCWIEPGTGAAMTAVGHARTVSADPEPPLDRIDDVARWGWSVELEAVEPPSIRAKPVGPWLVVGDDDLTRDIAAELTARGERTSTAPASGEAPLDGIRAVCIVGARPNKAQTSSAGFDENFEHLLVGGTEALRRLAASADSGRLVFVTQGAVPTERPSPNPAHALALGPALVGAKEYPHVQTVLVDTDHPVDISTIVDDVVGSDEPIVVLGSDGRRSPRARARELTISDGHPFRRGGTYVVTGGLGRIGAVIATHLASSYGANLAVATSSRLPAPADRAEFLATHGSGHPTTRRLRRLEQIEACGGRVVTVTADLSDPTAVRAALNEVETTLGPIDGVIHAAGRLRDRLVEQVIDDDHEAVVGVKARAAVVLAEELTRRGVSDLILISSTSTMLAPAGQCSYVAANAVLDALAGHRGKLRVRTIGFGTWTGEGMAVDAARNARLGTGHGELVEHPVLHEHIAESDGTHRFVGELDVDQDWVVDEHRINGEIAVLPGTGHLDLMLSGLAAAHMTPALQRVALIDPLVVADSETTTVRVTIDAADDTGTRKVRIESDAGPERGWTVHSEAEHRGDSPTLPRVEPASPQGREFDPLERPRRHLRLGPHWPAVDAIVRDSDEVRARVEIDDELAADSPRWLLHPGVADVATACAAALDPRLDDVLFVPVSYRSATSKRPLSGGLTIEARRDPASNEDSLITDVYLADDSGEVVAAMEGLELRATRHFDRLLALGDSPSPVAAIPPLLAAAVDLGITPPEGLDALERVLTSGEDHRLVSSIDLDALARAQDWFDEDMGDVDPPTDPDAGLPEIVRAAFEDLLGVAPVGLDDDFFELGGHSLIGIRLLARLQRTTGVRLQLSELLEAPTPRDLALRLSDEPPLALDVEGEAAEPDEKRSRPARDPDLHPSLVPVRTDGDLNPLFVVHGAGGNVLNLWGLARHLPPGRPIYGIQAAGIDGQSAPDPTIEAMATRYVDAVRSLQPQGPYLLGGYSGGGVVALQMVRQFKAIDETVLKVVMIDTVPRNSERPTAMRRYLNALREAVSKGPQAIVPWLRYSLESRYDLADHDIKSLGLGYGDTSDTGVVNLADHFEAAVEAYEFGTYDVDVVIAKAQAVYPAWPRHYGWKGRVKGRIDTFVSPGNHFEMLTKENAPVLAARLAPHLTATEAWPRSTGEVRG